VPIAGLAVEITAHAQTGKNHFEIRLDPPELGRIDVRLDVDSSGNVTSRLVVERAETLEVLRRDAPELQRALLDFPLARKGRYLIEYVLMKDVNEFLASIELNPRMGKLPVTVTYQDSCHLAHGQRVRTQPRKLLRAVP
jgi:Fe-S oxidoreductase